MSPTKVIVTFFFLVVANMCAYGQTMVEILKLLPEDNRPDANVDSLIQFGRYDMPGGTEEMAPYYTLKKLDEAFGILRYRMDFGGGAAGFVKSEIRRFRMSQNELLIVYSAVGGTPAAYNQEDMMTFIYQNGMLAATREPLLPPRIPIEDFVKPGTPKAVIASFDRTYDHYELTIFGLNVAYILSPYFSNHEDTKKWLRGDKIEFVFDKGRFKRLKPSWQFEEEERND